MRKFNRLCKKNNFRLKKLAEWQQFNINDNDAIQILTDAMNYGYPVQIEYQGSGWRNIQPYGWNTSKNGDILLMCYKDNGEVRSYRMDRIEDAYIDMDQSGIATTNNNAMQEDNDLETFINNNYNNEDNQNQNLNNNNFNNDENNYNNSDDYNLPYLPDEQMNDNTNKNIYEDELNILKQDNNENMNILNIPNDENNNILDNNSNSNLDNNSNNNLDNNDINNEEENIDEQE